MAVLSPSTLETCDIGTSGWNAIYSTNFTKINTKLGHLMSAAKIPGVPTVANPDAQTSETLTDSTTGTVSNTINDVGSSFSQATLNNNFASLVDENNKLRADVLSLRTQLVALLAELRKSTGVGAIGG
jgi:hypothetical protein